MPKISMRVTRAPRLDVPRFTRDEMREITQAVLDAEVERIKRAEMPDGSAAKPLAVHTRASGARYGYAIWKQRKYGSNRRDWTATGEMLAGLRVTVSDASRGVIKFASSVVKKAMIRENIDHMFDLSKKGEDRGTKVVQRFWDRAVARMNRRAA